MSCILPHKQAILNLSQDLAEKGATKPGMPWIVQNYAKAVGVIKEFEDGVRYYLSDEFDMPVAEIRKNETKLERGSSDLRDNIKTTYKVIPNKEFLDKLDAKRKELGIYDSKLSLSDYFEDLQEQYDIIEEDVKSAVKKDFIQEQILSPEMEQIIKNTHPQAQDGMTQLELDFLNNMPNKEC